MPLAAGQFLSFHEILGPLGGGAMGEVHRARDTRLEREVAIKILPDHFANDEERLRRFEREAKSLASLNHSNVAQVHGVDQVDDTCFLVLELVPGETLEERLERGPLNPEEAIDVCRQIAEGLEAAHEAGVISAWLADCDVSHDGERLVMVRERQGDGGGQIRVVLRWFEELRAAEPRADDG
jgi:serine/threonine protein kinase